MAKENLGFAAWPKKELRALARKARKTAADNGTVHKFTKAESKRNDLAAQTPANRREIGRKGGLAAQRSGKVRLWRNSQQARTAALKKGKCLKQLRERLVKPEKKLMPTWEAADFLGVCERTIYALLKKRQLKRVKMRVGEQRVTTESVWRVRELWRRLYLD